MTTALPTAAPGPDPRVLDAVQEILDERGISDPAERAAKAQEVELEVLTVYTDTWREAMGSTPRRADDRATTAAEVDEAGHDDRPADQLRAPSFPRVVERGTQSRGAGRFPQLAANFRKLWSDCGLTYDEIAEKVGVSRTTLVAIARGQRRPQQRNLKAIADFFKITVRDLCGTD